MESPAPRNPRFPVRRWTGRGLSRAEPDAVSTEEPLQIRVDMRPLAVVMRTPGHDDELVAGFLVAEGLLRNRSDLRALRPHPRNRHGNVLDVHLADGVACDLGALGRHVAVGSSCGVCGRTTLESVRRRFPRPSGRFRIPAGLLAGLPDALRGLQRDFSETGGLHAASLFGPDGRLEGVREDVGRHNAVDKVVGRAFLDGRLPLGDVGLLVSGRVSFEIVEKAVAAGIGLVAAVSAPSSLAVDLARRHGVTLVGFLRSGRFNVYAAPRRIVAGRPRTVRRTAG